MLPGVVDMIRTYNTVDVNSSTEEDPHNSHCLTCIVPGIIKKRVIIQLRTNKIDKTKKII